MIDYELVLEEEAFPFEERAIGVHEKNLELLSVGIFNPWIERSLEKLANLMPGRYAKFEASGGLIASIDRYAYRAPSSRTAGPEDPELEDGAPPPEPDAAVESTQRERAEQRVAAR
jgi:hypothetical protein